MSKTPATWCGKTFYVEDLLSDTAEMFEHNYERIKSTFRNINKLFENKEAMTDRIKLEDMTLKQIRELKEDLKKRIADVLNEFNDETGLYPTIKVTYDVERIPVCFESYGGRITAQSEECEEIINREISIDFNKRI